MFKDIIYGVHLGKEHQKSLLTAYFDKANPSGNLRVARLIFHIVTVERNGIRPNVGKEGQ